MEIDIEKLTCGIQLTDIERNVLEYLLTHLDQALKLGVRGVARENFTSTSTVMRLSRKLGYNGFIEMYYKLLGAVGGVSRGYEVNEDFVSHFVGKLPEPAQGGRKNLRNAGYCIYLWYGLFLYDGKLSGKKTSGFGY